MLAAGNSRLKLFQIAFIQLGEQAGQMVELVNAFVFSQAGVEFRQVAVIVGNKNLLILDIVNADPFKERLYFLGSRGEFQRLTCQLTLVVFPQVGDIRLNDRHISAASGP